MLYIKKLFIFLLFFIFSQRIVFSKENNKDVEDTFFIDIDSKIEKKLETIYGRPYSLTDNKIEYRLLKANTFTMFGMSIVILGFLYIMPESFTNWDKDDSSFKTLFKKWSKNVSKGPVVDEDDFVLNYVAHPYCGAVYYMAARSSGANAFYSFLYSVFLSTFFWEYGIEAFAEVPSVQDLIVTPVIGSILGEGFYITKRHILENDYKLLHSSILGHMAVVFMDPITEISKLFIGDSNKKSDNKYLSLYSYPTIHNSGNIGYNIVFNIQF